MAQQESDNAQIYVVHIEQDKNGAKCVKEIGSFEYNVNLNYFMKAVSEAVDSTTGPINKNNIEDVTNAIRDSYNRQNVTPVSSAKSTNELYQSTSDEFSQNNPITVSQTAPNERPLLNRQNASTDFEESTNFEEKEGGRRNRRSKRKSNKGKKSRKTNSRK
jgi:hypothetical protein